MEFRIWYLEIILKKITLSSLLLLLIASFITAQDVPTSASKVKVSTTVSKDKVSPGDKFDAKVVLEIQQDWHVNAHVPTFEYLLGTDLKLMPKEGIEIADTRYPEAKKLKFAFSPDILDVYSDRVEIVTALKILENAPSGKQSMAGKLRIQACNDQVCLAPSTVDVQIPVEVTRSNASTDVSTTAASDPTNNVVYFSSLDNEVSSLFDTKGTLLGFLGIFLIGLALNLTPCVYPMLSVTVSLFGGQTDTHMHRVFLKASIYVLGIATMYSVLGVVAALSGGLFGSLLQSPWVLTGIAVLLFALALSMFGLYELRMPSFLVDRLGHASTSRGTAAVGIYFSGLAVGIFAAPCIGPPIIALLAYVGAKGNVAFGFWAFFILSLGLGAPYLLLGTFSGLLKRLPKSGVWMVWVKKVFGVLLLGVGLFYLGLALLPKFSIYVLPLALLVGGIYLGFLEKSGKGRKTFQRIQWAIGGIAVILAALSVLWLRKPEIHWQPYSLDKLQQALLQNQPVMMDFYADWCIPCLELDHRTFTDPQVIAASEGYVKLKVDFTQYDSPDAQALQQQFNIMGVPTILFLGPNGRETDRITGFLPPDEFLLRMTTLLSEKTTE
ncbi:thioredoxin family protein [bacterium]|nr:thioredoxin family protein [bacterium]